MIVFFTHTRPFEGEFDALQRMAIESWYGAVPECKVILFGHTAIDPDVFVPVLTTNEHGTSRVDTMIAKAQEVAAKLWPGISLLCMISSDIVLGAEFPLALEALAGIERPFVIGQRWDIAPGAMHEDVVLHPPAAVDYFIFRPGALGEIPPFAVGRTAYDNWLVWAAIEQWNLQVIDATEDITAIHVNHDHPEYGDKATMLASEERQENIRLAKATGMPRWYGVDDAPWVMCSGRIQEREAIAA